jgi:predicted alpha-1,2-mannosidase
MKPFIVLFLIVLISCTAEKPAFEPASFVNPFIGTGQVENHINGGNTYPGAVRPWGMVSMSPHNIDFRGQVASTTYTKNNPFIFGFGHTHISGMGCNASGAILLKATSGNTDVTVDHTKSAYSAEIAVPGYYSVHLDKFNIQAEFTTTERAGISRFRFPKGNANLMVDLGLTPDFGKFGKFEIISDSQFQGYKREGNTCDCKKWGNVYFYGEISKKSSSHGLYKDWIVVPTASNFLEDENTGGFFGFDVDENEVIEVRVGVSYVSTENARINLLSETKDKSFDEIRQTSLKLWNSELSKIKVEGESVENKTKFYTALYHSLLHPNLFSDVNGEYRMHDTTTIGNSIQPKYTNFSMWDTYRTLHPLLSLVYPEREEQMVNSLVEMYKESGWLPRIEVLGHNTGVMVGDPASIVINDSYQKGITKFDQQAAFDAMIKSATYVSGQNMNRSGFRQYMQYGFIPQDKPGNDTVFGWFNDLAWGTVSTALEFNLNDWNISQFAQAMGDESLAQKLDLQSKYYQNFFDSETGFFRPRNSDNKWYEPFDPLEQSNTLFNQHMRGGPGFVEGSAWNYLFFVPHDMNGLIKLIGGQEKFISRLQEFFDKGYYDATNEPNIAFPFLFNYVKGEEWRSQKTVQELIKTYYSADEFGMPGNDDAGTMSAWLVFAMMGIYPDCPGLAQYQLVKPGFEKVTIKLNGNFFRGNNFVIENTVDQKSDSYIKIMELNGSNFPFYNITHDEITKGGKLIINP